MASKGPFVVEALAPWKILPPSPQMAPLFIKAFYRTETTRAAQSTTHLHSFILVNQRNLTNGDMSLANIRLYRNIYERN